MAVAGALFSLNKKEGNMTKRMFLVGMILLLMSILVAGCGGYQAPGPAPAPSPVAGTEHQVTIENFAFSPAEITIKVGDTVTWTEQDAVHHTTTGSIFDSGDLGQEQTYSKTFDQAGIYDYSCNYHSNMKGKVIVVE